MIFLRLLLLLLTPIFLTHAVTEPSLDLRASGDVVATLGIVVVAIVAIVALACVIAIAIRRKRRLRAIYKTSDERSASKLTAAAIKTQARRRRRRKHGQDRIGG